MISRIFYYDSNKQTCVWRYREFTSNENNTEKSIFASTQSFDFEEIIYQ